MKRPRVLLADDHPIVLEGLRHLLEPGFDIVGEAANGRALVAAARKLRPDVIVADISMPLLNGIEAARQIRKLNRKVKIVFLTMHSDPAYAVAALCAGGSGYVLKRSAAAELLEAIRESLSGRIYVSRSISRDVVQARIERAARSDEPQSRLTFRQREVLQLVAEGRTGKEIAEILHLSTRTVESHKYQIMQALGLRSIADLVRYAVKSGIVSE